MLQPQQHALQAALYALLIPIWGSNFSTVWLLIFSKKNQRKEIKTIVFDPFSSFYESLTCGDLPLASGMNEGACEIGDRGVYVARAWVVFTVVEGAVDKRDISI